MAKQKAAADQQAESETITVPATMSIPEEKPRKHTVELRAGMVLTVVPDGSTSRPIDDVSKTIWRSRADTLKAAATETKGVHA